MKEKGKPEMWSILKGLTTNKSSDTARVITDNGTNYITPKQKANVFVKLYRGVSWLNIEKPDRGSKKLVNSRLRMEQEVLETCSDFTLSEVKAAIKSFNQSKASEPDLIHPRFLHHIGPIAVTTLQRIWN